MEKDCFKDSEYKYTFDEFLGIIARLRGENGCPWDREQTHESLRPCIMEESAELSAAIRIYKETGDYTNMQEELGDVLLQVVLQSQIAREEGIFTIEDVIQGICGKMIRRHPHVFGNVQAEDSRQVLKNWEEIKKEEKSGQSGNSAVMADIPLELPALTKARKVLNKADKLRRDGKTYEQCYNRLQTLTAGLGNSRELPKEERERQFGQALFALADLARQAGIDAEQSLTDVVADQMKEYD